MNLGGKTHNFCYTTTTTTTTTSTTTCVWLLALFSSQFVSDFNESWHRFLQHKVRERCEISTSGSDIFTVFCVKCCIFTLF